MIYSLLFLPPICKDAAMPSWYKGGIWHLRSDWLEECKMDKILKPWKIITRGLYILNPRLEGQKRFCKEQFYKSLFRNFEYDLGRFNASSRNFGKPKRKQQNQCYFFSIDGRNWIFVLWFVFFCRAFCLWQVEMQLLLINFTQLRFFRRLRELL